MIVAFVFLGEFGYELLNWQGVVRKARAALGDVRVICASRRGLAPLYDDAEYVDISAVPAFRATTACGYYARLEEDSPLGVKFDKPLRRALRREIRRRVGVKRRFPPQLIRFVFSSDRVELAGCTFGADPIRWGHGLDGSIYEGLDLSNNRYSRISASLECRSALESRLGFSLEVPYVLVQRRRREIVVRSRSAIADDRILRTLARRLPVVAIDFSTGRRNDSYSVAPDVAGVHRLAVDGFPEQSCLIHHAAQCVFFTEGDFGSHIYVPPFLGRDVIAVAPSDIYAIGTTPIDFWNKHVFRFGGAIVPTTAEELEPDYKLEDWADRIAGVSR